jgi:hypothetical protein
MDSSNKSLQFVLLLSCFFQGLLDGDFHVCVRFETRVTGDTTESAIGYADVFYDVFIDGVCPDQCRFSATIDGQVIPKQFGEFSEGHKCVATICDEDEAALAGPLTPGQEFFICAKIDYTDIDSDLLENSEAVIYGWGSLECTTVAADVVNPIPLTTDFGTAQTLVLVPPVSQPYADLTELIPLNGGDTAQIKTFLFEPYTSMMEDGDAYPIFCTGYVDIAWGFERTDINGNPTDPAPSECPPCPVDCDLGDTAGECYRDACRDEQNPAFPVVCPGPNTLVATCGGDVACVRTGINGLCEDQYPGETNQVCVENLICYEGGEINECWIALKIRKRFGGNACIEDIMAWLGGQGWYTDTSLPEATKDAVDAFVADTYDSCPTSPNKRRLGELPIKKPIKTRTLQEIPPDAKTARLQYGMETMIVKSTDTAGAIMLQSIKTNAGAAMTLAAGGFAAAAFLV